MLIIQRAPGPNVTVQNDEKILYVIGDADTDESWRLRIQAGVPHFRMTIEHRETPTEFDINLDEDHQITVENNTAYTSDNPYYATVLTDSRSPSLLVDGLAGNMTGRVISWDGFIWINSSDQWFPKGDFSESITIDRGIFQRMNVIDTDPSDHTRFPPAPAGGSTIGTINGEVDGSGFEVLALQNMNGFFGTIPINLHNPGTEDHLLVAGSGTDPLGTSLPGLGIPWTPVFHAPDTFEKGHVVMQQGRWYRCNETGFQNFFFEIPNRWDVSIQPLFEMNLLLTDNLGSTVADNDGNVMIYGSRFA